MLRLFRTTILCLVALLLLEAAVFVHEPLCQNFQRAPISLRASQVLPGHMLSGTNFTVRDAVTSDGFINIYDLDTSYGSLRVESTALLAKRIGELRALALIEQLRGSDVYLNAAGQAAAAPIKTVRGLVQDPSGTVSGVATGIGRMFSNVSGALSSDNPYKGNALNSALGQESQKREYAYRFGVDPYTPYQPLQKALNDLAWTAAVGGLTVKAAFMAIPGGAGLAVGFAGTADTLSSLVRDKTPIELAEINQAELAAMGVPDSVARHFLRNPAYDPMEQTLLVGALASMTNVANRGIFVETAAAANEESIVVFQRTRAQILAAYRAKTGSVKSFVNAAGVPVLQTSGGKIVAVFPLDYVAWTASFAEKATAVAAAVKQIPGIKGKELWVTGRVDPVARKALESKGWKVEEKIQGRLL